MADQAQPLRIAEPEQLARANIEFTRLATNSIEHDAGARHLAVLELERTNAELERRLAERTLERDDAARERALIELGRSNAELKLRLTERTLERDEAARLEALEERARSNAELAQRLALRTIERDDVARNEALEELARTNGRALVELARTNAELNRRLAERTRERDDAARGEAQLELGRTNARAVDELARTSAELELRLAERTNERDAVARDAALALLAQTKTDRLEHDLEREYRASHAFQDAALPKRLPTLPGFQFDAIYQAAQAEALVGGDWYDAFRLDDGRIVLSIGDVIGNGLSAAVTMGAVRQALRGASQILADPIEILDAADRAIRSEQPERIVTAFVGILDPITLSLTYGSAGHPPPLIREANGDVRVLGGSGLPLGLRSMDPAAPDIVNSVVLNNSSLLVFYTDGLLEATRDLEAGERKLHEVVKSGAVWISENPAAAISAAVLDEVLDDVAIMTVRIDCAFISVTRPGGATHEDARWTFAVNDRDAAAEVRYGIVQVLREYGAPNADTIIPELIFSELLGNVVRHGGATIECALDVSGDAAVLHALDYGPGFAYSARLPSDNLSDSGRGLFIVKSLARELVVTKRLDGGSHVRAVLPFPLRKRHRVPDNACKMLK